jgi:uncharacterized RDD family membrane protein YckC
MTEPTDPNAPQGGTPDPYAGQQPPPPPPPQQYGQPAAAYGQQQYGYPPAAAAPPYVDWLHRVGSYLIDALVSGVPAGVLIGLGFAIGHAFGTLLVVLGYIGGLAIWLWNVVFRQGNTGQSIGKEQLNQRLVRESDGQPIGPGMSFIRQIAHILDGICYIGYLWPLWDTKRQTFADKVCSTIVVRT